MSQFDASLPGAWTLDEWQTIVDGAAKGAPFDDATGFLLYRDDGWMSAILSAQGRAELEVPVLAMATDSELAAAARQYVSYAGTWSADRNEVRHHVRYSLFPNWIGQDLVRQVSWRDGKLVLTTPVQISASGKSVAEQIVWRRATQ
jgi:hypothetical protein